MSGRGFPYFRVDIGEVNHAFQGKFTLFFVVLKSFNNGVKKLRHHFNVGEHDVGVINAGEESSGGSECGYSHLHFSVREAFSKNSHEAILVGGELLWS